MVIQRSDTISTISTTGSSQFTDARSTFTDAHSQVNLQNSKEDLINQNDEKNNEKPEDTKSSDNEIDVKTKQPESVKPPKAYVSKDDKIRAIQQQKKENGYQKENGDCHEYICSNNIIDVLDLPNWKFWVCGLCTMCCNTCVSSSTTAVKTTATK